MSRKDKRPNAKNWCFTINNPIEGDETIILDSKKFKYSVFGREKGDEGTPHLQGYVCLWKEAKLSALKKLFPRAHLEVAKGSPLQNRSYCIKDGDFAEQGVLPIQGGESTKKNWDEAKKLALIGRVDDIPGNIYIPHYRNLLSICVDHSAPVRSIPQLLNEWHWGPTGTGKSMNVRTKWPDAYIKSAATEWWNGYDAHEVVIIEDLDIYHVKLGYYLKIWSDHYPFPANVKGSRELLIRPKRIIVTSNYHPRSIWTDVQTLGPIERRFHLIEYKQGKDLGCDETGLTTHFNGDVYTITK